MTSNNSPLRLGLLTTLDKNIGDDFIREGLVHVIQQIVPNRSVQSETVDKHEPHTVYPRWHPIRLCYAKGFRPCRKTARLRRHIEHWLPPLGLSRFDNCDLIVQCGTPIIWEDCRNSEWARLIWRDVLARLARSRKLVLNLGGGSCYPWERQPATLAGNRDEPFVRLMLNAARLTTVRDRLTREMFASLGYQTQRLCCPAMLVGQSITQTAKATRKVIINYMQGGGHYDFGQEIDAKVWEDTMRRVIAELCRNGWKPLLLAHNKSEFELAGRIWPDLPRACPANQRDYFDITRDAAFGVFNRMHASVVAAGLGVPSVAIGNDSRNLMVETLGLPVFYVKEATADCLLTAISELVRDRDAESRRLLVLRDATIKGYKDCLDPFLAPAVQ